MGAHGSRSNSPNASMISRGVYHSSEAFADRSKDVFMYYLHLGFYEFLYDRNFHQPFSEYKQSLLPSSCSVDVSLLLLSIQK